jgi:CBS domain-containing protein
MKVETIYRPDAVTAKTTETLREAARRMDWMEIGALPVMLHDRLVGIITERDITRALADNADPGTAPIARYMTPEPFTAGLDEDAHEVARRMLDLGIRHLPVVRDGDVVGIISARDLLAVDELAS